MSCALKHVHIHRRSSIFFKFASLLNIISADHLLDHPLKACCKHFRAVLEHLVPQSNKAVMLKLFVSDS